MKVRRVHVVEGVVVWPDEEQRLAHSQNGNIDVVRISAPHDECHDHESAWDAGVYASKCVSDHLPSARRRMQGGHARARAHDEVNHHADRHWKSIVAEEHRRGKDCRRVFGYDVVFHVVCLGTDGGAYMRPSLKTGASPLNGTNGPVGDLVQAAACMRPRKRQHRPTCGGFFSSVRAGTGRPAAEYVIRWTPLGTFHVLLYETSLPDSCTRDIYIPARPAVDHAERVLELVVMAVPAREERASRDGVRSVMHAIEHHRTEQLRNEELARRLCGWTHRVARTTRDTEYEHTTAPSVRSIRQRST